MQYVLIIHAVESYPAWKLVFSQAASMRKKAGELSYQLLRDCDDENHIVHLSRWASIEKAKQFFESPELVEIRKKAGVKAPTFHYLHHLESHVL